MLRHILFDVYSDGQTVDTTIPELRHCPIAVCVRHQGISVIHICISSVGVSLELHHNSNVSSPDSHGILARVPTQTGTPMNEKTGFEVVGGFISNGAED